MAKATEITMVGKGNWRDPKVWKDGHGYENASAGSHYGIQRPKLQAGRNG
ncbi:MAG: hypothetical protein VYC23_02695 [Chloroflexota bacterium]|nr:hypothetical protein [Chloroflexota bacterium]